MSSSRPPLPGWCDDPCGKPSAVSIRTLWWEDVDFCARLRAGLVTANFPCDKGFVVQPAAHLRHAGGSSVAALGDVAFLTAYYRNLLHYTARHHPGRLGLVRRGLRISLATRALLRPTRREAYKAALEAITRDLG